MKRKNHAVYLTRGAIIAALYVLLTYLSALFGLASGAIQLRLSELLCILPIFFAEAIPGLFIGCILSNLLTGAVVWDIVFGSIATLIGAIGARIIGKVFPRLPFLATVPTILSNALIVPFVLAYAYGAEGTILYFMLTVGIGELLSAGVLGTACYYLFKRVKFK